MSLPPQSLFSGRESVDKKKRSSALRNRLFREKSCNKGGLDSDAKEKEHPFIAHPGQAGVGYGKPLREQVQS